MRTFGFTQKERRVVLFLLVMVALGTVVKIYRQQKNNVLNSAQGIEKKEKLLRDFSELGKDSINIKKDIDSPNLANEEKALKTININTATETEIQKLPLIGPVLARRVVEYRTENGGFKSIDEIKNVKGIGEKIFERIRHYIKS